MKARTLPLIARFFAAASMTGWMFAGATLAFSIEPMNAIGPLAEKTLPSAVSIAVEESDTKTESEVLALVESHLPELATMLSRLRKADADQYRMAIRNLSRWSRRLEIAKKRDAKLFEIEVESLKAESSVNFLAAKLKVRDSKSDRQKLLAAVERLGQSKLARARYDVDLMTQRLRRAKAQLEAAEKRLRSADDETDTERQRDYRRLLEKAGREP